MPEQGPFSNNPESALLMTDLPQPCTGSLDPFWTISTAIQQISHISLIELGEKYFSTSKLDDKGETRKQPRSEVIVLVAEHFARWLDDIGMGARILNECPHIYVGTHWQLIDDIDCKTLLGELAERLGHDKFDSRIYSFREKLLKQMYSSLSRRNKMPESGRVLINLSNGTLEVVHGMESLREFRKVDNLTYRLPFEYDPEAACPIFDQYFLKVLPDPASRQVLSEFIGWLFLKDLKLEKALILLGVGHNGKSVFFEIIKALLGEHNVTNLSLSSLSKPEKRFTLGTALLNFASEINNLCDADVFKKLTSGEPIEARRLYKNIHTISNYARLAFNANVLPKNTEQTEGFFRRFLIVPFTVTISAEDKDPDLAKAIIASEMPGVFNWVMRGLRRLRETRKFSECEAAELALSCYRKESDSVALFLDEKGLQASPDGKIGKDELYQEFRYYCVMSGSKSLEKGEFGKRLKNHQIDDSKSGSSRFWRLVRTEHGENFSS